MRCVMTGITITYYGHSCFTIEAEGYSIALDPYDGHVPGYAPLKIEANEVLCSHEHSDHNFREAVLLKTGGENPFKITEIHSYHDPEKGALRGVNTIRIFEHGGLRIAHLGDIGCRPEDEQTEQLKALDAVLAPVGGTYTFDAKEQKAFLDEIKPRVIIPMHYRFGSFGFSNIGTLADFTNLYEAGSVNMNGVSSITLTKASPAGVTVLEFGFL